MLPMCSRLISSIAIIVTLAACTRDPRDDAAASPSGMQFGDSAITEFINYRAVDSVAAYGMGDSVAPAVIALYRNLSEEVASRIAQQSGFSASLLLAPFRQRIAGCEVSSWMGTVSDSGFSDSGFVVATTLSCQSADDTIQLNHLRLEDGSLAFAWSALEVTARKKPVPFTDMLKAVRDSIGGRSETVVLRNGYHIIRLIVPTSSIEKLAAMPFNQAEVKRLAHNDSLRGSGSSDRRKWSRWRR